MSEKLTREEVLQDVIDIFIESLAYLSEEEKKTVNENTHAISTFNVVDFDSMVFDTDLVKHFSVKPDLKEWGRAAHLGEIADLFLKCVNEKEQVK